MPATEPPRARNFKRIHGVYSPNQWICSRPESPKYVRPTRNGMGSDVPDPRVRPRGLVNKENVPCEPRKIRRRHRGKHHGR